MQKSPAHKIFAALLAFALAVVGLRAADAPISETTVFHLQNGDRVTGTILTEGASEITIQSPSLGKITLPLAQVKSREKAVTAPAASAPSPLVVVPKNVAAMPAPKPKPPKRWNTDVQLGMNLRYATKDANEYLAAIHTTYAREKFRETLDYNFLYGKTEGILSANRMTASSKSDFDVSKGWYVYNLMGAGYDEVRRIDLQYEIGPGAGAMVWHSAKNDFTWKSELGFNFEEQFRKDHTEQLVYSARVAQLITWKVGEKLATDARIELFPNLQDFSEYRVRFETTVRYPLLKNVSLNVMAIDLYDTLPVAGVSKNDFQLRSALGLRF